MELPNNERKPSPLSTIPLITEDIIEDNGQTSPSFPLSPAPTTTFINENTRTPPFGAKLANILAKNNSNYINNINANGDNSSDEFNENLINNMTSIKSYRVNNSPKTYHSHTDSSPTPVYTDGVCNINGSSSPLARERKELKKDGSLPNLVPIRDKKKDETDKIEKKNT